MPYSDNMYSTGNESDNEDYTSRLSPSDGQFPASSSNITPHIPNIYIPDPTLQQQRAERAERGAESRAREAEEDKRLSFRTGPGSHPSEQSFFSRQQQQQQRQAATTTTTATFVSSPPRHHHHHHHHHHHREVTYSPSSAAAESQAPAGFPPSRAWSPSVYSEAPPAYSPSPPDSLIPRTTTSTTSSSTASLRDSHPQRSYNTFGFSRSIMGAPPSDIEGERLLGPPQPESMGGPPAEHEPPGDGPAWTRRARRHLPRRLGWKYALLALVVLVVSAASLSGILSFSSSRPKNGDNATPGESQPVELEPEVPQTPGGQAPGPVFQPPYCRGEQHRFDDQILALDFQRSLNFTFKEAGYKNHGSLSVHVAGRLDVRRLKEGDGEPRVVLEIATNEPSLRLYTSLDADAQEMRVTVPEVHESTVPGQRPCVEMKGTVWVPAAGAELGILALRAVHLDVLLFDDLSLRVADYTEVTAVAGDVRARAVEPSSHGDDSQGASILSGSGGGDGGDGGDGGVGQAAPWAFDSRVIEVRTTSGDILGDWPLYDLLGLHTTSGAIRAGITPLPGLPADDGRPAKPAVLSLTTISGAISVTEPIDADDDGGGDDDNGHPSPSRLPRRDYLVDVRSTSGGVRAALAFGAGITVRTTASDVALRLLPVLNIGSRGGGGLGPGNPAQLETVTTSGATAVRVLEPLFYGDSDNENNDDGEAMREGRALDCLEATHKSTSGNVGLRYPRAWEGTLYAETTAGRLAARGRGLRVLRREGGWPGAKMEARKGEPGDKSTIRVHALLGGMDALIGDEA